MEEKFIESGLGLALSLAEKGLEKLGVRFSSKPHLVCKLYFTPESELVEERQRTKYSDSEYGLEIINIGSNAFLIDTFALWYKKTIIMDGCELSREERCIEPNKSIIYMFSQQDAEALCYHCHKNNLKECDVHIISVDGKKVRERLDVEPITVHMALNDENSIIG